VENLGIADKVKFLGIRSDIDCVIASYHLVLHKGKIVEQGTHREIMKKGGVYTRLYRTQAFLQN